LATVGVAGVVLAGCTGGARMDESAGACVWTASSQALSPMHTYPACLNLVRLSLPRGSLSASGLKASAREPLTDLVIREPLETCFRPGAIERRVDGRARAARAA
jgi:hypothetical protein